MFARIRCRRCHLSSLWTDDPEYFLRSVCVRPSACEAKLLEEEFSSCRAPARPRHSRLSLSPPPESHEDVVNPAVAQ